MTIFINMYLINTKAMSQMLLLTLFYYCQTATRDPIKIFYTLRINLFF